MKKVISVWKPVGMTPLGAVKRFKEKNPIHNNKTVSYAGRLDPMAEGIMLLLIGEENKKRKEYEVLKKTYETEIVLGITTDSFDALGVIQRVSLPLKINEKEITSCLGRFVGRQLQLYPPYSSKPFAGKPLFWWARQERLPEIEIPQKEIEIYDCALLEMTQLPGNALATDAMGRIKKINGDFRQDKIIIGWKKFGKKYTTDNFIKIKLQIECSSGTYIRQLAEDVGKKLGCGAFAISIKRIAVGNYTISNCVEL
ncbi:MAG: hypothetical protein Q7T54_05280 [Candidatus Levybacteria bacterium]|nr:hypothetical protein [Candidatus Levybacteria bacterium]